MNSGGEYESWHDWEIRCTCGDCFGGLQVDC